MGVTRTSLIFALTTVCLLSLFGCGSGGDEDDSAGGSSGVGGAGASLAGRGATAGSAGSAAGSGGSAVNVPSNRRCQNNSDCVTAYDTGNACYSRGCSAPLGVRADALASDACLVAWPTEAPDPTTACRKSDSTMCPALCDHPYPCYAVSCVSGQCTAKGDVITGVCR